MKRKLLKLALCAAALLVVGTVSVKAQRTYTYDFTGFSNNYDPTKGTAVTVGEKNMWKLTIAEGSFDNYGGKFEFAYGATTSNADKSTDYKFKNYNSDKGFGPNYANRMFAILSLKAGYKVSFKINKGGFKVFDTNLKTLSKDDAIVSETAYEVNADGDVIIYSTDNTNGNYNLIETITITTDEYAYATSIYIDGEKIVGALPGETYSDGYNITAGDVKMTLGTLGGSCTWTRDNYTTTWGNFDVTFGQTAVGNANPLDGSTRCNDSHKAVPNQGEYFTFEPTASGKLEVYGQFQHQVYLSNADASSWQKVDVGSSATWTKAEFDIVGGTKYWFWNDNRTFKVCGFAFTPTFGVHITSAGYATFGNYSASNLQAPESVTVYAAAYDEENNNVVLNEVSNRIIPAGQGVIVKAAEGNYPFSTTATDWEYTGTNDLVAQTSTATLAQTDGSKTNYILASDLKFYAVDGTSAMTAGKAYLSIARDATSRGIDVVFGDGETTGINMVQGSGSKVQGAEAYYNLAGQRVSQPTEGLYIVNGKKVIIK